MLPPPTCSKQKSRSPLRTEHHMSLLKWWLLPPPVSKATGHGSGRVAPLLLFIVSQPPSLPSCLQKQFFFWIILGYFPSLHHIAGIHNLSDHFSFIIEDISTSLTVFHMTTHNSMTCHHSWSCLFPRDCFIPNSETSVPPRHLLLFCDLIPHPTPATYFYSTSHFIYISQKT